jgi:hypothetical protein
VHLKGINGGEIIETADAPRAQSDPVSASLRL